jgi:two-component system cell cycle sensor histidine kinase PleC
VHVGKIVWSVCFVLLLCSSPLLVLDLIAIQRSVETASGIDIWYDGQLGQDLLRLQVAVRSLRDRPTAQAVEDVRLRLDNAFNRVNSLPNPSLPAWHTQGIAREEGISRIMSHLRSVDRDLALIDSTPAAFLDAADREVAEAVDIQRHMSLMVLRRQNDLTGHMQSQVVSFKLKLLAYGLGFAVLVVAMAWLMRQHMTSETALRATNAQLLELTRDLVAARDAALRSSQAKSNFLANVSHEVRTPLNAIIGFSEALTSGLFGALGEKQVEYVGDILTAGRRLLALINDILDLAKLDAGKATMLEERVDLQRTAFEAVHDMRETARLAGLTLHVHAECPGAIVSGDRLRLRQVLDNLLSNAVKFTPAGGRIDVRVGHRHDGGTFVTVRDTGVGIPSSDLGRVFLPFEQSESHTTYANRGTGLGLPMVRHLVEAHGGIVNLSSERGSGTEVTIDLPPKRTLGEDLPGASDPLRDPAVEQVRQASART